MSFEKWLIKQKKRKDHIGDLARDFISAKETKRYKNEKCDEDHLGRWNADPIVYGVLWMAREEYEKEVHSK